MSRSSAVTCLAFPGQAARRSTRTHGFPLRTDPDAHYHHTAVELLTAVASVPSTPTRPSSGLVDVIVAGAGTGGTLSGLSKRLRGANPNLISLGVDPVGSILARPESLNVLKDGESAIYKVRPSARSSSHLTLNASLTPSSPPLAG